MTKSLPLRAMLAVAFAAALSAPSFGQESKPPAPPAGPEKKTEPQKEEKKPDAPRDEAKKDEPKKDQKAEEYEKFVKDLKKAEGPITLYQKGKQIFLELPEEKLGRVILFQASMASGASTAQGMQSGDPIGAHEVAAYRFEKQDEQLVLVRPNLRFRWDPKDPLAIASERSFPEAYLASYRIQHHHAAKKLLLIDASSIFQGDTFKLNDAINAGLGGQYMLDTAKSSIDRISGFKENTVVSMRLHFFSPRAAEKNPLLALLGLSSPDHLEDSRSLPLRVTHNMWFREESGYMPRLSDARVGYFTGDFYSVGRFLNPDRTERYIVRWNLRKKDPEAELSEPVKPIVWTLDPSIPEEYRPAVREGLLRWNRAFERIGFKNAVRVQDAPSGDKDYDHADGRYNVVRWTMSPDAAYAVSIPRIDPFTGEILNASITVDANLVAFIQQEHQTIVTPASTAGARAINVLTRDPERRETADAYVWEPDGQRARAQLRSRLGALGWDSLRCDHAIGLAESGALGWNALVAAGPGAGVSKEAYAKLFLADVVSHEAGHCLGLRHNFVASTNLTVEQLADDRLTSEHGLTASVMDYTPVNIVAVLKGKGNFYMPSIGKYDVWAVQYGYAPSKAETPLGEKPMLASIAARSTEPGHGYMTDEDADNWNPFAVRFDNGKDPVAYSAKVLDAAARMRDYAIKELPRKGESYARRTQLIMGAINQTFIQGRKTARFIGGIHARRDHRGSAPIATLAPVDPTLQRRAMRLIVKSCFSEGAFDLPSDVLTSLSQDPNTPMASGWVAPLRDMVSLQQSMLYSLIMSADTTDRIAENAFKTKGAPGTYGMDEHFSLLMGAIFSEVGQDKNIAPNRRDLQRFATTALMTQAGANPGAINEDVRVLASDTLKRLEKRFAAQLAKNARLDGMTKVHLRDTRDQMARFLNRSVTGSR